MMSMFGWTLVKVQDCVAMVTAEKKQHERAREAESRLAIEQADIARYKETVARLRLRVELLDGRADFAETTVQGLTTANGALWSQNERLLGIVAEMRRAGFEMIRPEMHEPNDQVRTVEQDDAEALKGDKTLIATSDD